MSSPSLSIILPTYNERENIKILIPEIEYRSLKKGRCKIFCYNCTGSDG
jgi:hypothetical protein